jgi:outer membrane protein OmpA-like peptidoglycan-associated protein
MFEFTIIFGRISVPLRSAFIGFLGLLMLTGCSSFKKDFQETFVGNREDTGEMAAMSNIPAPPEPGQTVFVDSNGVTPMPNSYVTGAPMPMGMGGGMPSYEGGIATNDASVTVFPLDGAAAMPQYEGISVGMNNWNQIYFKSGSSRLGSGDRQKLSQLAEQAKFAPVNRITVAGYASRPTQSGNNSVNAHILNLKESMNRTFEVSKNLLQNGVPAEKIKAVSWGATKASGNDQQDRRVDVIMGEQ